MVTLQQKKQDSLEDISDLEGLQPQCPNLFVKKFTSYEIGAQIKCWLTSLTRVRLLQEKYDSNARFIVYRHDQLTKTLVML